jgi:YggT family protein
MLVASVLRIYQLLLVLRAILSWFHPDPYNQYYQMLIRLTEPVLGRIRKLIPLQGIDISPFVAIFLIDLIRGIIISQA